MGLFDSLPNPFAVMAPVNGLPPSPAVVVGRLMGGGAAAVNVPGMGGAPFIPGQYGAPQGPFGLPTPGHVLGGPLQMIENAVASLFAPPSPWDFFLPVLMAILGTGGLNLAGGLLGTGPLATLIQQLLTPSNIIVLALLAFLFLQGPGAMSSPLSYFILAIVAIYALGILTPAAA